MAKYNTTLETATLHISKGNNKIGKGIYAFSTLPGNETHPIIVNGEVMTDITGTCSHHCDSCFNSGCYAVKSAKLHHNAVIPAWSDNTLLLRSGRLFDLLKAYINVKQKSKSPIEIFRVNVSGEIIDEKDLAMWNELAILHPEIKFGVYTKNFRAVDKFMKKHKNTADNFCINISEWHGVAKKLLEKYPNQFNVFEYDDSNLKNNTLTDSEKLRLASITHCPAVTNKGKHAVDKNGIAITCDRCLRCYNKTGKRTAVYAH